MRMVSVRQDMNPSSRHYGDAKTLRWKLIVVMVLTLAVTVIEQNILVTVSASVEHRWFWRTGTTPSRGDYATFWLQHPLAGDQSVRLTKRLVCWSGDALSVKDHNYYCNGNFLGVAKSTGLDGQALPQFVYQGPIPEGKAFAFGVHTDSFDSRYWGLVTIEDTERLSPIFASNAAASRP